MLKRVLSGIVIALVMLALVYIGNWVFLAGCMFIFGVSAWEFGHMYDHSDYFRVPLIILVVLVELLVLSRWFLGLDACHRTMTGCLMAALLWAVIACERQLPHTAISFAVLTAGVVYIGWLGSYMISIYQLDHGVYRLLLCLALCSAGDVGAFFVGRSIGKHKMLPFVSPKKTWEGYLGGIAFTVLSAILIERFIPQIDELLNMPQIIILALIISILSPIGDFGESMIKRSFGFKDSSNLIPGHGGYFDRLDTVFWAMPISYYFYEMVILGLV